MMWPLLVETTASCKYVQAMRLFLLPGSSIKKLRRLRVLYDNVVLIENIVRYQDVFEAQQQRSLCSA